MKTSTLLSALLALTSAAPALAQGIEIHPSVSEVASLNRFKLAPIYGVDSKTSNVRGQVIVDPRHVTLNVSSSPICELDVVIETTLPIVRQQYDACRVLRTTAMRDERRSDGAFEQIEIADYRMNLCDQPAPAMTTVSYKVQYLGSPAISKFNAGELGPRFIRK